MVRPVVDDEALKNRLDTMTARVLSACVDLPEIQNKPPEYHSSHCPVFKDWRVKVRAAREAAAGAAPQSRGP